MTCVSSSSVSSSSVSSIEVEVEVACDSFPSIIAWVRKVLAVFPLSEIPPYMSVRNCVIRGGIRVGVLEGVDPVGAVGGEVEGVEVAGLGGGSE